MICEGECQTNDQCLGEVKLVEVSGWGKFFYCENAIKVDRKNGLKVRLINNEGKTCWECTERVNEECGYDGKEVYSDTEACNWFKSE